MDRLLPKLAYWRWHWNRHTLVMFDEFDAFNAAGDWIPPLAAECPQVHKKLDAFIAVEPFSWPEFIERKEVRFHIKPRTSNYTSLDMIICWFTRAFLNHAQLYLY